MNAFFVAIVLFGCVWSAQSQYACTYPHGGDGSVFDSSENYVPGSVLTWTDVAENIRRFWLDQNDAEGNTILDNWNYASVNFDQAFQNNPPLDNVIANTLKQAGISFGLLKDHIVGNPGLAQFLAETYISFNYELDTGTYASVNSYMKNAFGNFDANICNPTV